MADVFWTGQAERDLLALPDKALAKILAKVENIRLYPQMYPRLEGERWEGCRKVVIEPSWIMVYRVMADGAAIILYIRDGSQDRLRRDYDE